MVNLEKLYKGPALKSYAYEGKSVVKFASIGLFTDKEVSERLDNVLVNKIETQFSLLKELRRELYANINQNQMLINNENMKALLLQEDEKFSYLKEFIAALRVNDNSTNDLHDKQIKSQRRSIRLMKKRIKYNDLAILHISQVHENVTNILIQLLLFWKNSILPKIKAEGESFISSDLETSIVDLLSYCFSSRGDVQELIKEYQESCEYCVCDSDIMHFDHWERIKNEFDAISFEDCEDQLIWEKYGDDIGGYDSNEGITEREKRALLKQRRFGLIGSYVVRPYIKMLVFLLVRHINFNSRTSLLQIIISTFISANEEVLKRYNPILSADSIFAILNNDHEVAKLFLYSLYACGELTIEGYDKLCAALETGNLESIMAVLWAEKRARIIVEQFENFFLLASHINRRVNGCKVVPADKLSKLLDDSNKSLLKIYPTDKDINKTNYLTIVAIHNALMDSKVLIAEEANALSCIVTANSNCLEEYQVMLRMAKIMLIAKAETNSVSLPTNTDVETSPTDDESNNADNANKIKKEQDNIKCSIDTPYISQFDVEKLVELLTTSNEYADRAFVTIVSRGTHDVQTCLKYFFNSGLAEFIECKDTLQFKLKWRRKNIVGLKLLIKLLVSKFIDKDEVIDVNKYDGISDKLNNQNSFEFWPPVINVFDCKTIKNAKLGEGRSRDNYIKDLETIVEIVYACKIK